jgi:uncharacterized protein
MNIFRKTFFQTLAAIGVILVVVGISAIFFKNEPETTNFVRARIKDSYLNLEIADNSILMSKGLSGRESLDEDAGMIFVYEYELENLKFWMKDMLISLDMIFVNGNWEIVDILENVPVCEDDPCESFGSEENVQYVIEVNAGWVEENSIEVGDRVDFIANPLSDS